MTLESLRTFLMWCTVINGGFLLLAAHLSSADSGGATQHSTFHVFSEWGRTAMR